MEDAEFIEAVLCLRKKTFDILAMAVNKKERDPDGANDKRMVAIYVYAQNILADKHRRWENYCSAYRTKRNIS
jgi:hypothetical protein